MHTRDSDTHALRVFLHVVRVLKCCVGGLMPRRGTAHIFVLYIYASRARPLLSGSLLVTPLLGGDVHVGEVSTPPKRRFLRRYENAGGPALLMVHKAPPRAHLSQPVVGAVLIVVVPSSQNKPPPHQACAGKLATCSLRPEHASQCAGRWREQSEEEGASTRGTPPEPLNPNVPV